MFMALSGRSTQQRHSTLERRHNFHLGEAQRAALQGSHDKAAGHSWRALLISRELWVNAADSARHDSEQPDSQQHDSERHRAMRNRAGLAAALSAHARYHDDARQAIEMLTESAGHYAALAETDPALYEVPRIDVLTRIALASDAAGAAPDAIALLREVVGMYLKASPGNADERDLGLARARFHLGRCLIDAGLDDEGIGETEAGLELAADVLDRMDLGSSPDWLVKAPAYLQLAAPDWVAAACRAMARHAMAGRLEQAATAARTAIQLSGALADFGGDILRDAHQRIHTRAVKVLEQAAGVTTETIGRSA